MFFIINLPVINIKNNDDYDQEFRKKFDSVQLIFGKR